MPAHLHLTFAIPGLLWPHQHTPVPSIHLPALNTLRQWGKRSPCSCSRSDFYQQHLSQESWTHQAEKPFEIAADCHCFIAVPISQTAGMHQLNYIEGHALSLTSEEAEAFCQILNTWLQKDNWQFWPLKPDLWLVTTPHPLEFSTPSLLDLHGYIDGTAKPTGKHARQILQQQTELQMLLHQHPLNHERRRHGYPPINAVWFEPERTNTANGNQPIFTNSNRAYRSFPLPSDYQTLIKSINQYSRATLFNDELCPIIDQKDQTAYLQILEQWEHHWWHPLLTALRSGQVQQLDITTDGLHGNLLRICKPKIPPFWRKTSPFNGLML